MTNDEWIMLNIGLPINQPLERAAFYFGEERRNGLKNQISESDVKANKTADKEPNNDS